MKFEHLQSGIQKLGAGLLGGLSYVGGMSWLLGDTSRSIYRGLRSKKDRLDISALSVQIIRVGLYSLPVVGMVQMFIGAILALQLSPVLETYGQESQIASIIGIAGFRMLSPIFTAVLLSGFAGASIAAELGTMVVSEEVEALEGMAINPIRFLIVPRTLATCLAMILLTTFSDLMEAFGGYLVGRLVLGADVYNNYWDNMQKALSGTDYVTGLIQGGVFGLLIGLIACYEGMKVRGGAAGVGRATTMTVVYSIVAIVIASCICTVLFYAFGW